MLLLLHIHHIPPNSDFIIISNDEEVKKIHQYIFSFVVIKWEVIVLYGYVFLLLFIHLRLLIIYYTTTPSETVPIINSSRSLSASSNSNISNEGNNIIVITAKQPSKTYVYQIFEPNHPSHHYQDQSTQNQFKRNQCNNALSVWQQVSTGYSRADSWTRGLSYIQHDSSSDMPNMHLPFSDNSFFANRELVTNSGLVDGCNNRRKQTEKHKIVSGKIDQKFIGNLNPNVVGGPHE